MPDAVALALSVVAGLLVAPFLSTLVEQVPARRPVRWPSLSAHPPVLYWWREPADRSAPASALKATEGIPRSAASRAAATVPE